MRVSCMDDHVNHKLITCIIIVCFQRYGPLTGICSDPVTGNLWTWAKMILQAYHPYKEGR